MQYYRSDKFTKLSSNVNLPWMTFLQLKTSWILTTCIITYSQNKGLLKVFQLKWRIAYKHSGRTIFLKYTNKHVAIWSWRQKMKPIWKSNYKWKTIVKYLIRISAWRVYLSIKKYHISSTTALFDIIDCFICKNKQGESWVKITKLLSCGGVAKV